MNVRWMRRAVGAWVIAASAFGAPGAACAAADTLGFGTLRDAVARLDAAMASYCRGPGAGALVPGAQPLSNREAFSRACARSLAGKPIPSAGGWTFFYDERAADDGEVRVSGAQREIEGLGRRWSLVIGRTTQVYRPHQQPERIAARPEATLFAAGEGEWQLYWRYVDPAADRWHRPPIAVGGDFTAEQKQELAFLDKVFTEVVRREFPRMTGYLRDTRGMGFDK